MDPNSPTPYMIQFRSCVWICLQCSTYFYVLFLPPTGAQASSLTANILIRPLTIFDGLQTVSHLSRP